MSIEDIFTKIANHMVEGIAFHDQVSICYDFIGIRKFAKDHAAQYMEESKYYRSLLHYYSTHYHKLLKIEAAAIKPMFPEGWHRYDTFQVDISTKKKKIKELTNEWVSWERTTKTLYQEMYCAAINEKEIDAAMYIKKLIKDVSKELKEAEQLLIDLESIDYDMPTIITRR